MLPGRRSPGSSCCMLQLPLLSSHSQSYVAWRQPAGTFPHSQAPPALAHLPTRPPARPPAAEDYHWWWRAYLTSGSSALYLFLYSLFYFYTKLDITKLVPALMYFGERRSLQRQLGCPVAAGGGRSAAWPLWPGRWVCLQTVHASGLGWQQLADSVATHTAHATCPAPLPPRRLHDHRVGHLLLPYRHNRLL